MDPRKPENDNLKAILFGARPSPVIEEPGKPRRSSAVLDTSQSQLLDYEKQMLYIRTGKRLGD